MDASATSTLAYRLRAMRLARGLTQIELAVRADVSLSTVVKIELEQRKTPVWATILALATALAVDPLWLQFGIEGTPR